jgi:hypothetical protein
MVRHWGFKNEYYSTRFETCCALVNFDIHDRFEGNLQKQESENYGRILAHICSRGRKTVEASAERVAKRRARKQRIRDQQAQIDQEQGIDPEDDERRVMAAMDSTDDSS